MWAIMTVILVSVWGKERDGGLAKKKASEIDDKIALLGFAFVGMSGCASRGVVCWWTSLLLLSCVLFALQLECGAP